jgi:acyl-CoA synthetase (AMP-forming)/AMP-acid ligase II
LSEPGADPRRAQLDAQILAWMADAEAWPPASSGSAWKHDEARFERLAGELFRFQFEHCDAYGRFCEAQGASPDSIGSWREIPAVPTGAFKEMALRSFPDRLHSKTFRTSGTSTTARGELQLDSLALYEASLVPTIRRFLFPDLGAAGRMTLRVLAAPPGEQPDSSLSHMFGCTLDRIGSAASRFDVRDGVLAIDALTAGLEAASERAEPVALCGTAFAFVHLLETLEARAPIRLAPGSRVMETGGFKGRSRELPREELYLEIERHLGVAANRIVNQYGMTELGSQFYDSVLALPAEPRRKLGPPWTRVRVVDPETGLDAPSGAVGTIVIHDLANTGSVAAIATADLGRSIDPESAEAGFEVLGRQPDAEARGCSIAAELMLTR